MNKELNLKIEDLFRWTGQVEITDEKGDVIETLYQRVIGDADIQKARIEGLKASKTLRKELRDENSDSYLIYVPIEEEANLDDLIFTIILGAYPRFRQQSEFKIKEERVKEPKGDADLETQEKYIEDLQKARDSYEEKLNEDIQEQIKKFEEELRSKSHAEVFNLYKTELVNGLCNQKMMSVFNEFSTFYGTYSDENFKERRFESIEAFRDLSHKIKTRLIENYTSLELNLSHVKK